METHNRYPTTAEEKRMLPGIRLAERMAEKKYTYPAFAEDLQRYDACLSSKQLQRMCGGKKVHVALHEMQTLFNLLTIPSTEVLVTSHRERSVVDVARTSLARVYLEYEAEEFWHIVERVIKAPEQIVPRIRIPY